MNSLNKFCICSPELFCVKVTTVFEIPHKYFHCLNYMLFGGRVRQGGVHGWCVGAFTTYVCLQNALKDYSITFWHKSSNVLTSQSGDQVCVLGKDLPVDCPHKAVKLPSLASVAFLSWRKVYFSQRCKEVHYVEVINLKYIIFKSCT